MNYYFTFFEPIIKNMTDIASIIDKIKQIIIEIFTILLLLNSKNNIIKGLPIRNIFLYFIVLNL